MRYVFLNLKEHPRGNYILSQMIVAGFVPELIIEERSTLAEKNRCTVLNCLRSHPAFKYLCPTLQQALNGHIIPYLQVSNHNELSCYNTIIERDLDLAVLGDTRIIKSDILHASKDKILNIHPGYLPNVRGNTPYIWAAYYNLPQGCTAHFIDEGIDTGPILFREKIEISAIHSYSQLIANIHITCGNLAVRSLQAFRDNSLVPIDQKSLLNRMPQPVTYSLAPQEIKDFVIKSYFS